MKEYRIQFTDINMQEALSQIESLQGLDHKQRNCLLLLTEEMFSMMASVLENREATFEIIRNGTTYSLGLLTRANVSLKARQEYMSMSSDGKNLAYKGLKGKMVAMFEYLACEGVVGAGALPVYYGMSSDSGEYAALWMMSSYMASAPEQEKESDWDGMEKSIIGTFADDVMIGVKDHQVEMIVKKVF